jgi:hypothetical protein
MKVSDQQLALLIESLEAYAKDGVFDPWVLSNGEIIQPLDVLKELAAERARAAEAMRLLRLAGDDLLAWFTHEHDMLDDDIPEGARATRDLIEDIRDFLETRAALSGEGTAPEAGGVHQTGGEHGEEEVSGHAGNHARGERGRIDVSGDTPRRDAGCAGRQAAAQDGGGRGLQAAACQADDAQAGGGVGAAPAARSGSPPTIPGWEPSDGVERNSQIVNGAWYRPRFGCDSLQIALDDGRSGRSGALPFDDAKLKALSNRCKFWYDQRWEPSSDAKLIEQMARHWLSERRTSGYVEQGEGSVDATMLPDEKAGNPGHQNQASAHSGSAASPSDAYYPSGRQVRCNGAKCGEDHSVCEANSDDWANRIADVLNRAAAPAPDRSAEPPLKDQVPRAGEEHST